MRVQTYGERRLVHPVLEQGQLDWIEVTQSLLRGSTGGGGTDLIYIVGGKNGQRFRVYQRRERRF